MILFRPPRIASTLATVLAPAMLLVAGCAQSPDYQRPALPIPATLGALTQAPDGVAHRAQMELSVEERAFLRSFSPTEDLAPLVTRGLTNNADFRMAAHAVAQAQAQYRVVAAAQLPQMDATASSTQQHFDSAQLQALYGQKLASSGLGVSDFELDFFGKMRALSEGARNRYLASTYGQQAARGALIAEVLRAYTIQQVAARVRQQAEAAEADSAALLVIAQQQSSVGVRSQMALYAQQKFANQTHLQARQAADEAAAAMRALQSLVGYDLAPLKESSLNLPADDIPLDALRNLPSELLLQRPDLQQAQAMLRAAHADMDAARAAFYPSIRLSTSIGTASDDLNSLFDSGTRMWTFSPQLVLPIFDGGRNQANLESAKARQQSSVADFEKAIQSAFREVADALATRETLHIAESLFRAQVHTARQQLERTGDRVAQGLQDKDVLLTERMHAREAEIEYSRVAGDLTLNRIALFRAFYGVTLPTHL